MAEEKEQDVQRGEAKGLKEIRISEHSQGTDERPLTPDICLFLTDGLVLDFIHRSCTNCWERALYL